MSILSFLTIEIAIAIGVAAVVLIWLAGKFWKLLHNRYFWLVAIFSTGALAFALYDMGHRQSFFNWLGITKSALGWAYTGGKTIWQHYGDSIIAGWNTFIGFFVQHPSIGWVVAICIGGAIVSTLGIIMIGRFGIAGLKFFRKKLFFWALKSILVSCLAILLIELNLLIVNPEVTIAIKGFIISQVGNVAYGDVIWRGVKGGISSMLYRDES